MSSQSSLQISDTFQICLTWLKLVTNAHTCKWSFVMNVVTCTECFFSLPSSLLSHGCLLLMGDAHLIGTIFVKVCFISAVIWLNYLCLISKWCAFLTWLDKSPWTIEFCMSFVCKSACVLVVFSIWGKWSWWIWVGISLNLICFHLVNIL